MQRNGNFSFDLSHCSLVGLKFQHEVLVVVEPLSHLFQHHHEKHYNDLIFAKAHRLKLFLAKAVQREQVIFGLKKPRENLAGNSIRKCSRKEAAEGMKVFFFFLSWSFVQQRCQLSHQH